MAAKVSYTVSKKEQEHMNCFISTKRDFLKTIMGHLPERFIKHSERVRDIVCLMAGYVPKELQPEDMGSIEYCWSLSEGAYYHDIGVYLARNDIELRPLKGEKLLREHWQTDVISPSCMIVLETVRDCCERVDGSGYPNALSGDKLPVHASICAIADTVDMMMNTRPGSGNKAKSTAEYIKQNAGILFRNDAVTCFEQAWEDIFELYLDSGKRIKGTV